MTSYEYTCIPIWFLVQVPSPPQTLTSCTAQLWIPSDQEIRNAIITIPIAETGHAQKKRRMICNTIFLRDKRVINWYKILIKAANV